MLPIWRVVRCRYIKATFGQKRSLLTPSSPSKFLMAAFVLILVQKVTAKICPVQLFVKNHYQSTILFTFLTRSINLSTFSFVGSRSAMIAKIPQVTKMLKLSECPILLLYFLE